MSKILPIVLLITILPAFAAGKSPACGLASQLQQPEIPLDIAVKADHRTAAATRTAMDWWAARLSTPARPITWHPVEDWAACMIYIRYGWEGMMPRKTVQGYTYLPYHERYDGLATVNRLDAWVVAHEIGHLIGCIHGNGVMHAEYHEGGAPLWIDDEALHFARLVRLRASGMRLPRHDQLAFGRQ
jgi:hypothetical protein